MEIEIPRSTSPVNIKVVGVGGGGCNTVRHIAEAAPKNEIEYLCLDTHWPPAKEVLRSIHYIQIGKAKTKGLGSGANPETGMLAAKESQNDISDALHGTDMVIFAAGMGGGTGTGAVQIVADAAKNIHLLTVGFVTVPFSFEGMTRIKRAWDGIHALIQAVDSLIVIPNENLKRLDPHQITMANAFAYVDDILGKGIQSVLEIINTNGFINLDFADIQAVMKSAGYARMGIGQADGPNCAEKAAKMAISSPLHDRPVEAASGIIINFTCSPDSTLDDIERASALIAQSAHPDATVIWGVRFDESMKESMRVIVIATGFQEKTVI